jgi:hypothetical protein
MVADYTKCYTKTYEMHVIYVWILEVKLEQNILIDLGQPMNITFIAIISYLKLHLQQNSIGFYFTVNLNKVAAVNSVAQIHHGYERWVYGQ